MPPLYLQGRRRKEYSRHRGEPAIERDDIQQIHPSIRPQPSSCAFCVLLVLVLAVRLSDREKNDNSIPSKETVAAYILEKGEQYAAEQLRGQDRNSVRRSWGDPDAMPSGIWADVWGLDADTTILVFYDAENDDKVERAALGQKGE